MPAATVPKTPLALGAGYLYYAPSGTSLPTNTVASSAFSVAWASPWALLGVTKEGQEFSYEISVDEIEAAEYADTLQYVTTKRVAGMKFELMLVHATNMARALNMASATSTSGSGTTLLTTVQPPALGAEVRCMIGWESQDSTERLVMEQAFQVGSLTIARKKGADNATLPLEFRGEVASSGYPFQYFTAGTARG